MKPINTSTYDFPTLIQEGFVYVGDSRPVYYVGISYNPAPDIRTTDDITCERA